MEVKLAAADGAPRELGTIPRKTTVGIFELAGGGTGAPREGPKRQLRTGRGLSTHSAPSRRLRS